MFKKVKKEFQFGQHHAFLETGYLARQADGAVLIGLGDTRVLATVVAKKEQSAGQDFFPLTVDYIEKSYSAGRIPGGFFKREGRATEKEILTARLIDRPLRPLFPDGFLNEVQVTITVLSFDPEVDPDIPAMIAASAALSISGIPFMGPIGAARVGFIDNAYVLNPTYSQLKSSELDLVVAGTAHATLMVESAAKELPESVMLGAVTFGQECMQTCIQAIEALAAECAKPDWQWEATSCPADFSEKLSQAALEKLNHAYCLVNKQERVTQIKAIYTEMELLFAEDPSVSFLKSQFAKIQYDLVRSKILAGEKRIDGRDTRSVRPIDITLGLLPRAHGSAVFTRGETQAVVTTTLGTDSDAQIIDALKGESRDYFLFHYNMPPFATCETGRLAAPKRREVGHGNLAKRALLPLLPSKADFPYTMRVVSEITESNGSSSMASVCGACLSLMDAGVPLKAHVAGVAMGLIKEGNKFAILTDILGDEDHLGDMDFKVAGTVKGVTALQMDIKITGVTQEIMEIALMQAKSGRMHILQLMQSAIADCRDRLSLFAPRMERIQVNPEKIHLVIGKGGSTIKSLTEEDGTSIDIHEDGTLTIAASSFSAIEEVKSKIQLLTAEVEANKIYEGKVIKIFDFGVVVDILPGRDGLLHVSQLVKQRGQNVSDLFKEGQSVRVKVIGFDEKGRPRLSTKEMDTDPAPAPAPAQE